VYEYIIITTAGQIWWQIYGKIIDEIYLALYDVHIVRKEGGLMPSIKPVSALKNYTSIVNEVTYGNRVYFTKNGHGICALVDMAELDELDKQKALLQLMTKLAEAKVSVREEGTISADDLEKELGL
jgi:hypothetical protein